MHCVITVFIALVSLLYF